ncbi:hypothetical protein [Maricaulis parjimensis]|uniref:hypothetical protein n=1 Tax=Maricaulis parjimensis TaxID=144023 RepID=UPI0019396ABE|nr:hypothetical protein [Maricaulis parjimensis]
MSRKHHKSPRNRINMQVFAYEQDALHLLHTVMHQQAQAGQFKAAITTAERLMDRLPDCRLAKRLDCVERVLASPDLEAGWTVKELMDELVGH